MIFSLRSPCVRCIDTYYSRAFKQPFSATPRYFAFAAAFAADHSAFAGFWPGHIGFAAPCAPCHAAAFSFAVFRILMPIGRRYRLFH